MSEDLCRNALDAIERYYQLQSGWIGNGCEHGFKPSKSCPNEDCEERNIQLLFEAAMAPRQRDQL